MVGYLFVSVLFYDTLNFIEYFSLNLHSKAEWKRPAFFILTAEKKFGRFCPSFTPYCLKTKFVGRQTSEIQSIR